MKNKNLKRVEQQVKGEAISSLATLFFETDFKWKDCASTWHRFVNHELGDNIFFSV
jgi:hypothetical protein